jgi:hypothetical protein
MKTGGLVVAQFGQIHYVCVTLKEFSCEDLAHTATIGAEAHIRCALDPSQAQKTPSY